MIHFPLTDREERTVRWTARIVTAAAIAFIMLLTAISVASARM